MTGHAHDDGRSPAEHLLASFLDAHPQGGRAEFEEWIARSSEPGGDAGLERELRSLFDRWQRAAELLGEGFNSSRSAGGNLFRARGSVPETASGAGVPTGLSPGQRIGHFELRSFIAQGGMGQVWKAHDENLRADVALKLILPGRIDARSLELFTREARAGGRLSHPYIVKTLSTGRSDGLTWIAQELVDGSWTMKDCLDQLRAEDSIPGDHYKSVALFVARVADGLQAAHDAGVIHRDVKPANILIAPDDSPRLTDFGLARVVDDSFLSRSGDVAGTLAYMSPEQVTAKRTGLDHRTDVFSLGIVLYEMLTLRRPFEGDTTHQIASQIIHFEPPHATKLRSQCPRELAVICGKALEKAPDRRYATMREFSADLHRHLAHEPIHAKPMGVLVRASKWAQRHPARAIALASTLVLTGILLLFASILAGKNAALRNTNAALTDQNERADAAVRRISRNAYSRSLQAAGVALGAKDINLSRRILLECSPDLRGWEWEHLRLRLDASRAVYRDMAIVDVQAAAWSPDGRVLATATEDGAIYLRSATDGSELAVLQVADDGVTSLAWGPRGVRLATLSLDGMVHVWSAEAAGELPSLDEELVSVGYLGSIGYVDVDPRLAWDSVGDRLDAFADGTWRSRWEFTESGKHAWLDALLSGAGDAGSFAWSNDGEQLALVSEDLNLQLLDPASGRVLASGEQLGRGGPDGSPFLDLAWNPAGGCFATIREDQLVQLWEATDGGVLTNRWTDSDTTERMCWSPDGTRLALVSYSEGIRVIDARDGVPLTAIGKPDYAANCIAWSPDGTMLWADHTIYHSSFERAVAWGAEARLREPAHAVIDPLLAEFGLLEDVLRAVRSRRDLSGDLSEKALHLARLRGDLSAARLLELAWEQVDPEGEEGRDVELGLRQAIRAVELLPDSPEARDTLAWALLANGQGEDALQASERAIELARPEEQGEYQDERARLKSLVESARAKDD